MTTKSKREDYDEAVKQLENKGIAFKARLACIRPDINTGATICPRARVIPRKNNGHPVFISGRTNQTSFKNNTFILILKHFKKLERFADVAVGETGDSKLVGSCISRLMLGDNCLVVTVVLLLWDPTGTFMSEYRE